MDQLSKREQVIIMLWTQNTKLSPVPIYDRDELRFPDDWGDEFKIITNQVQLHLHTLFNDFSIDGKASNLQDAQVFLIHVFRNKYVNKPVPENYFDTYYRKWKEQCEKGVALILNDPDNFKQKCKYIECAKEADQIIEFMNLENAGEL